MLVFFRSAVFTCYSLSRSAVFTCYALFRNALVTYYALLHSAVLIVLLFSAALAIYPKKKNTERNRSLLSLEIIDQYLDFFKYFISAQRNRRCCYLLSYTIPCRFAKRVQVYYSSMFFSCCFLAQIGNIIFC